MILFRQNVCFERVRMYLLTVCAVFGLAVLPAGSALAVAVVVSHDINTFGSAVAGAEEEAFAVNVANFLTADSGGTDLLLYESNPGDPTRNFDAGVLSALSGAGFNVTVTPDYSTPFAAFDAIFVAQDFPVPGFLNNADLIAYAEGGGGVYLAGGVGGGGAAVEAAGWSEFLNHFGLAYEDEGYNGINNVVITSAHPIFAGIPDLNSGNGQSIFDLGTDPRASIVQFSDEHGVYAVVEGEAPVPEPGTQALTLFALLLPVLRRIRGQSQ